MNIKPLDDRVLIQPLTGEDKTPAGIIIPDTAKEKPIMGKVMAVGTDEELKEIIKEGDRVLFAKYGGEDISIENEEYKIVQRADILAIIEG